ncbi:unnamed protein product [Durusdinium trenchii]|uniref:Aminotransferase-like plant mobile domain-containing protein n=1 Tax=Durusdinium trenchii TaxID=1381693 RepID=A0ABP0NTR3_9DINO
MDVSCVYTSKRVDSEVTYDREFVLRFLWWKIRSWEFGADVHPTLAPTKTPVWLRLQSLYGSYRIADEPTMVTEAAHVAFVFLWLQVYASPDCSWSGLPDKGAGLVQRDIRRQQIIAPLACEQLSLQNCNENSICGWNKELERCQPYIAWFHVMKCGSTFGATLAHFANSSLPKLAHMPSCGSLVDEAEDPCPGGSQGPYEFFVTKYPKDVWFRDVFWSNSNDPDPGNHRAIPDAAYEIWKGHFVGLFRQPEVRVASAFNHFCEPLIASAEHERINMTHAVHQFGQFAQGTVTKMLGGDYGFFGNDPVRCEFRFADYYKTDRECHSAACRNCMQSATEKDVEKAIQRLQGFAFVGLTDHFDLSVCLFHAMFGGECLPVEFVNMRKSIYSKDFTKYLNGYEDPFDARVFQEASNIFWSNVQRYNVNAETCQRICLNSNATFQRAQPN